MLELNRRMSTDYGCFVMSGAARRWVPESDGLLTGRGCAVANPEYTVVLNHLDSGPRPR